MCRGTRTGLALYPKSGMDCLDGCSVQEMEDPSGMLEDVPDGVGSFKTQPGEARAIGSDRRSLVHTLRKSTTNKSPSTKRCRPSCWEKRLGRHDPTSENVNPRPSYFVRAAAAFPEGSMYSTRASLAAVRFG